MLRSYRGIVAALGLILVSAGLPPQQAGKPNQAASQSASKADIDRIATALEKLPQASNPDTGCEQGRDDRKSDLCAQWKAADAAYNSATWTRRTFWLGIVGAVIGLLTLGAASFAAWWAKEAANYTAKSVTEAQRSAQAAEDALTETRAAYAMQMRPYVAFADSAEDTPPKPLGRDGHIKFVVRNFGQIPARNVRFRYGYYICARPIGQAYANVGNPEAWGTIAPGDQRGATIYFADMPVSEYGRIAGGKEVMIVRAQIEYDLPDGGDTDDITVLITDQSLSSGIIHTISDYERKRTVNDDERHDAGG